jgi:hypothetical protein
MVVRGGDPPTLQPEVAACVLASRALMQAVERSPFALRDRIKRTVDVGGARNDGVVISRVAAIVGCAAVLVSATAGGAPAASAPSSALPFSTASATVVQPQPPGGVLSCDRHRRLQRP